MLVSVPSCSDGVLLPDDSSMAFAFDDVSDPSVDVKSAGVLASPGDGSAVRWSSEVDMVGGVGVEDGGSSALAGGALLGTPVVAIAVTGTGAG
jgi:hypothetical protein